MANTIGYVPMGRPAIQQLGVGVAAPPVMGPGYPVPPATNQPAAVQPTQVAPQAVPQTGLIGSENALLGGFTGAMQSLGEGAAGANNALGAYANQATPAGIQNAGANATQMQAAYTGALGSDAQKAAFEQYNASPALGYQTSQVNQALERSAAARGGLLSGNVLSEIGKQTQGLYQQDFQNNFNNLGRVSDTGLSIASKIADLSTTLGQNKAQLYSQTGENLGAGRTNAGLAIAQNASTTANNISQLLKEQGIGISDSMSSDITTISNLLHEAGMQDAADAKSLAQILANISGGQASNLQQGYQAVGDAQAAGILGQSAAIQNGITQAAQLGAFTPKTTTNPAPANTSSQVGTGQQYANVS